MSEIWNAGVGVVANVEADSAQEATRVLSRALERAGFNVFDDGAHDAFIAEEGTQVSELPVVQVIGYV